MTPSKGKGVSLILHIIYLDTLFLLNATVDYLLFLAAARVAGEPLPRIRFAIASVIGGFYAVLIVCKPLFQTPMYKLFFAFAIIFLAYGRSRHLLRQGLIFLALSAAFAGGILGISLFRGQDFFLEEGVFYAPINLSQLLLAVAVCYFLLTLVFQNFGKHCPASGELLPITLALDDKVIPLTVLVDTGNTLQDPVSGQSILVVEGTLLSVFFQEKIGRAQLEKPEECMLEHPHLQHRLRLLPYQAVGVQGRLLVLRVDAITVNQKKIPEKLVALSPTPVSDGGSYHGLIGGAVPTTK